jgi:catecholate siderophore receptor
MPKKTPLAAAVLAALSSSITFSASPRAFAAETAPSSAAVSKTLPVVEVTARPERENFQPDVSTVGAKTPTALRDIPQSVTVINQAVLQNQGISSFQEAIRTAPGITLGAAEGGRIGNNIHLRGFNARTDIYLDGFRDRGQYYRDTFNLQAIEVLYGPSSMLFGRGSTGGVINQLSKKANLSSDKTVNATLGTSQRYRATVDVNHPLSAVSAFRINAFAQNMGSTRKHVSNKGAGLAPQLRLGIGTPTELTISALLQHNRDVPDYGVPILNGRPAPVGRDAVYGLSDDRTIQDVQMLSAEIKHKINTNLTLRNQTRLARYKTDVRATKSRRILTDLNDTNSGLSYKDGNTTTLPPAQLGVWLYSLDRVINDRSFYNDTSLRSQFETGKIKHDLTAGIEVGYETYARESSNKDLPVVTLLNPAYHPTPPGAKRTVIDNAETTAKTFAVYANDTITLNPQWKVVGGLRWDRFHAISKHTQRKPLYANNLNTFVSARAGLIYQPTEQQSYYLTYGTSANPSIEQILLRVDGQQNLAPEKNRLVEVGGKWELLGGNLSLASAIFQIDKTNARTLVAPGEYELTGKIRVRGFQASAVGQLNPRWQVFGGYTLTAGRVLSARDDTQNHVPENTPRHTLVLWSNYKLTPQWEIGGGVNAVSSRYVSSDNRRGQVDGYARYDASLAYHQKKYTLRFNLLNLTNKHYYEATYAGGLAVPGIGRTAMLTLDYRF